MHKGHLTLVIFLLLELHSLIYLEILSYSFCFLFRIINLHSQTGSSKGVWGWEGVGGERIHSNLHKQYYTSKGQRGMC